MNSEFRNSKGAVTFTNMDVTLKLKNKIKLKKIFSDIFQSEGIEFGKISYIFTTDNFLLTLNKNFLKHNYYTDILTFVMSGDGAPICSEIYISIERIKENAFKFEVPFIKELYRVMIHGILHLCGYTDSTVILKTQMQKKENFYLNIYFT